MKKKINSSTIDLFIIKNYKRSCFFYKKIIKDLGFFYKYYKDSWSFFIKIIRTLGLFYKKYRYY